MDAKTTSIVAYLTWVGWLIAFFAGDKSTSLSKRHLNQALILNIACVAIGLINVIPVIGWVVWIFAWIAISVFAIMGIIRAVNEDETPLPLIGTFDIIK